MFLQQFESISLVDGFTLGSLDTVLDPLPQLRSRHFRSRSVFHEVVDGHTSDTTEPAFHVAQADVEVFPDAVFGHGAGHVRVQQIILGHVHVLAAFEHLVGGRHMLIENLGSNGCEGWMCHPGAVVASTDFTEFVLSDFVHGLVVGLRVVLDGDLSSHTTHCMDASTMASLDQKSDIGVHEGYSHGDVVSVRQDKLRVLAEFLDKGKDIIPTATVETGRVVAKLIDDFIHLKSGQNGLDEDSTADGSSSHANIVLRKVEDIVPESGFKVRFHLGQIEIRTGASLDKLKGVVEEIETKVEERSRHGLTVDGEVLLFEMPTSGSGNQGR